MIKAIIAKLETGSITNVIPRGQNVVNPDKPYVVVWQSSPILQVGLDNEGINQYFISVHFPKGYIDQLDDYIYNEVVTLLDRQKLMTRDGRRVELYRTMDISMLIEGNDDGTISKERSFTTIAFY